MDICSRYSKDDSLDDLNDIKQAILGSYLEEDDNESDGDDTSDVEELSPRLTENQNKCGHKCLGKSATSPCTASSDEDDDELETAMRRVFNEGSEVSAYYHAISCPSPVKLVSAMKGSRQKQGLSPKKLSVSWAPDVYDPPPTTVLHTIRGTKQPKAKKNFNIDTNNKKGGKKGQKGNNSARGGAGGKDKKQMRRAGGRNRLADQSDDDFEVGSPDPYCGSTFLKNSPTRTHFSVTEAL